MGLPRRVAAVVVKGVESTRRVMRGGIVVVSGGGGGEGGGWSAGERRMGSKMAWGCSAMVLVCAVVGDDGYTGRLVAWRKRRMA